MTQRLPQGAAASRGEAQRKAALGEVSGTRLRNRTGGLLQVRSPAARHATLRQLLRLVGQSTPPRCAQLGRAAFVTRPERDERLRQLDYIERSAHVVLRECARLRWLTNTSGGLAGCARQRSARGLLLLTTVLAHLTLLGSAEDGLVPLRCGGTRGVHHFSVRDEHKRVTLAFACEGVMVQAVAYPGGRDWSSLH